LVTICRRWRNFDAAAGTFTPTVGATTSTFTYLVNGLPPCGTDSRCSNSYNCSSIRCWNWKYNNNMFKIICSTIDLALVIGEQPGGV
jgi:hypothetical protein